VSGRADRSSAYAELVSGLLEARHDAASARFDAEVSAAEADGRIDERTARVLRWWQRESVRAVVEHARAVIPPALGALDEADAEAARANDDAASAWERATTRPRLDLRDLENEHDQHGQGLDQGDGDESAEDSLSVSPAPVDLLPAEDFPDDDPSDDPSDDPCDEVEPQTWAIPAARSAAAQVAEDAPRRLIVAGLNPLPRGSGPGQARRDTMYERRKE
jgi:hypothetical protein